MVRRLSIAAVTALATLTATVRLPAQACALNMPAAQKASCTESCCATMKSCVLSQQNQTPSAATKRMLNRQSCSSPSRLQSLLVQATVNLPKLDVSRRTSCRIHRHVWRFSARFSSDPGTLTPEVCPFTGTPAFQSPFWINENDIFFTLTFFNLISS